MQKHLLIHLFYQMDGMRKSLRFILPILFLIPATCFSQLLKGRVIAEKGEAAAGVSVQFKNKANTVVTNPDGSFKIMATKLPDTLVFSGPGFESYKVIITEKNIKDPNFEVVLLNKRQELSEVVVTGYSTSRKRDVTGAVSGRVPGLTIGADDSKAYKSGDVRIRGGSDKMAAPEERIINNTRANRLLFISDTARVGDLEKVGVLTAGEVNDFNKWKMWEDFNESEFKTWSELWGIYTNKRYSIQVTDKKRNAIINEPVYLINKISKDTVWRAFTDNTGKAELWAGFSKKDSAQQDYFISDSYGNVINGPSEFSKAVNLLSVDKSCQFSNEVDIAFVVDATGSMRDEIEFLKLELENVIRATMEKYQSLTLNAASVFYRDKGDEYLTKNIAFSDDLLKTLNFIKLQSSGGGGDTPEAVDEALATALDSLRWHKSTLTKLLFLVLDAPPHHEAKERIKELTLKAATMGVRIIPVACSGTDKSTEFLLRSMALATNGTYTFLTDDSGVGNAHIAPTTDKYEVELLGNLLQRLIGQYLYAKDCSLENKEPVTQQDPRQPNNILSVKIYPNPTSGRFTIESKKDIKEIFIADFTGKIIMKLADASRKGRWQVDISGYPSGAYLVKYITSDNKWGTEKVILLQ